MERSYGGAEMKRVLLLEDGTILKGEGFGYDGDTVGEVVFTTGMTGYQESTTDQSYNGQIITFTYPLIGNTGINRDDLESISPSCRGVIVREFARVPSNWRMTMDLDTFLKQKKIVGLSGIDTRMLTRKLRDIGVIKGTILNADQDLEQALVKLRSTTLPINNVAQVSTHAAYPNPGSKRRVVVLDFGLKHSILRELSRRDCDCIIMPYTTSATEILNQNPDGVMLTNGHGDPKDVPEAILTIQQLMGKVPVFGICLGHQLLALANKADTYKLKFGHRGFNHPVREIATGRIDFTSQNHGYAVDPKSIDKSILMVTHIEINDLSIEGIRHRQVPAFSVQFHPDATPGPHDGNHLFDEFMDMMDVTKEAKNA
jgi:carbamoyl-phosphate synthase small subunit